MIDLLIDAPWAILLLACATLGLAPFSPEPHIWEKLKMMRAGTLRKPVDIFDFCLHAAPFALLIAKAIVVGLGLDA